jgi:hypothetical protein
MNDKLKITKRQKEIIVGKLLGNGHAETVSGKTYRLKFEHSYSEMCYVDWLYQELLDLASAKPKIKTQKVNDKEYQKYWFNTKYSGSFRFYGQQFYPNGQKVVPKLIHRWLTPMALAVWFMDDGLIKSKECQETILNTQSFNSIELKRLQEAIKRNFDIETTLKKHKEGKQIYFPTSETVKLRKIIDQYVLPSMKYKLG